MVVALLWDSAGAVGWGAGHFCPMYVRGQIRPPFKSDEGAVLWEVVDGSRDNYARSNPIPRALIPPFLFCCDRIEADLPWRESFSGVSAFFVTLSCAAAAAAPRGHGLVLPGEDRGRTGSVRVHRLSGGRLRRRCASAPAPATLPLINGPGPDNWS